MEEVISSEDFLFPFKPYKIQEEFMTQLYHTLETQKYGIFESPTGTGKSLSIICSALKWLKDHNTNKEENLHKEIKLLEQKIQGIECSSTDWLTSQSRQIEITNDMNSLRLEANKIQSFYDAIALMKERRNKYKKYKQTYPNKLKKEETISLGDDDDNTDVAPADDLLLEDVENIDIDENEEENEAKYIPTKIYICSRTHSQLSQLVGEIKKSPYSENIRIVSLASRQNYCINSKVTYLKNNALINEKCLDMQKKVNPQTKVETDGKCTKRKKTESNCKCPYYKKEVIDELKESIILTVQDVEDLVSTAKEFQACPYYASRRAVEYAEVILVPYNTILHRHTREANGIVLKDNVVIIDEAHNLMDALAQMYGATLQANQVEMAHSELKQYKIKYGKRLSAINFLHINQLLKILSALKALFEQAKSPTTQMYTTNDFVSHAEIDHFNLFKIVEFIRQTKLSQKLHGFAHRSKDTLIESNKIEKKVDTMEEYLKFKATIDEELSGKQQKQVTQPLKKSVNNNENQHVKEKEIVKTIANPMLSVISFLEALQHSNTDGKILLQINEQEKKLQYLLLNAAAHFSDIVKECRSVIVAGGTMKPMSEFRKQLFINSGVDPSRIVTFTCDHIIPPDNILPIILTNPEYLFNYENRLKMGNAIKTVLTNACKFVVGGIVVFFPSYKYESWAWDQVKNINFGRPLLREPQESGSVESVLENYHKAIYKSQKRSAMLFSVVGGKLSEGLNFNDDLGRCVIVFGLPYANVNSPELKEKMTYLDKIEGAGAGKVFYENLCMKAVNQCVGRAIRHRNDYASVLLVDARYNRLSTKNMLPDWIKRSLKCCNSNDAFTLIEKFFSEKRKPL